MTTDDDTRSPDPAPAGDIAGELARVRAEERRRSARHFGVVRMAVALCTAASFALFGRVFGASDLVGADLLAAAYAGAAILVHRLSARPAGWAAGAAVPILDVPFTAALVLVMRATREFELALLFFNAAFLVLLIVASSLWLSARLIVTTAAVALAAEAAVQWRARIPAHVLLSTAMLFGSAAALCVFLVRRNASLAEATARHLARLRATEAGLSASDARYRAIVEAQADLIVRLRADGAVVFANDATRRVFGPGAPVARVPAAFAGRMGALLERLRGHGGVDVEESRETDADGQEAWYQWQTRAIAGASGDVAEVQSVGRDVTAVKRAEAQLRAAKDAADEATRAKSQFLANMSHEIRTPMNGVVGLLSLLHDTPLTEEQRRLAEVAHASATALLGILDAVLDFSKAEAGRVEVERVPFDPRALLADCLALVSAEASRKGLSLSLRVEEPVAARVAGAPNLVRQVLLNLLSNAVKFTGEGGVTVRASTGDAEGGDHLLRVEVDDTGIGITPEARGRLFVAFGQADASMTRRYGGTGLGLAISRALVEAMGGAIDLASDGARGTSVWFTVRVGRVEEACALVAPARPERRLTGRVLVVDDNRVNQMVAARMLASLGVEADVAGNGREALDALARPYDAVLMDCQMPELDGYEASREIRRREGTSRRTPIIALTAHALAGDRERCLACGMDDFLTKPLQRAALVEALARHLAP